MASNTRTRALVAAAAGLAGIGVGITLAPGAATAATTTTTQAVQGRLGALKDALSGLVKDGTLTQAQADKVATTLEEKLPARGGPGGPGGWGHGGPHGGGPGGPGGRGAGLEAAADLLGLTADELRSALADGSTLAELAKKKGISQATLVAKLVAAEKARLAEAVKDGDLTQKQADAFAEGLQERITAMVTRAHQHGDRGPRGGGPAPDDGSPSTTAPSTGD